MYEDPELPDFDSMSQEELIEWLEELTKIRSEATSEFIDENVGDGSESEAKKPAEEAWSDWLDAGHGASDSEPPEASAVVTMGDDFQDEDEDASLGLARFDERESGPLDAEAMAWLAEISAAETEENLPDIADYQPPEPRLENLDELLAQGEQEDPLDWLDRLSGRNSGGRLPSPMNREPERASDAGFAAEDVGDDFDDAYEDDERLNDLEDESLYSRRRDESLKGRESLLGLDDRESEKYSTQSMAPVPENVEPAGSHERARVEERAADLRSEAAPAAGDSLTQAFLLGGRRVDLEAWYNGRLRAIASGVDGAAQSTAIPALEQIAKPSKPPPPGLAAAINSARGKVETGELGEALAVYESLLSTKAGLVWVVHDIRGLIAQDRFRENPSAHRVLGDALMRQGHLNTALDVYRHALTLL
jgi:hypothetical protein